MPELRAAAVYRDAKIAVVAVESVAVGRRSHDGGGYLVGILEPLALVVRGPGGDTAIDLDGEPLDCAALLERVHGLDALLGGTRRG